MIRCSICGCWPAGLYPGGWRCADCTPARCDGRPEPPTPLRYGAPTLGEAMSPTYANQTTVSAAKSREEAGRLHPFPQRQDLALVGTHLEENMSRRPLYVHRYTPGPTADEYDIEDQASGARVIITTTMDGAEIEAIQSAKTGDRVTVSDDVRDAITELLGQYPGLWHAVARGAGYQRLTEQITDGANAVFHLHRQATR